MKLIELKENYKNVLENLTYIDDLKQWSMEERGTHIVLTDFFKTLSTFMSAYAGSKNKTIHAATLKMFLIQYLFKSYSIDGVVNILAALERREKTLLTSGPMNIESDVIIYTAIEQIIEAGYERCGTYTVTPFIYWLNDCGASVKSIREQECIPVD